MNWNPPTVMTLALFATTATGASACGSDGQGTVRPLGSDHLLYTIERAAEADPPGLLGRKFRLIVDESKATGLGITPDEAFSVSEVSRYEGNVTYSAEIVDEEALYKSESWGRLPRPLQFQVYCTPGGAPAKKAQDKLQTAAVPQPKSPPARMITLTPDALRQELSETTIPAETTVMADAGGAAVVEAYPQAIVESAPLPPVAPPPPQPDGQAGDRDRPRPAPRQVANIGAPAGALGSNETARLEVQLNALGEENASEGRTRLRYELVLRNPLSRGVQCDIEVESSYPRSFASDDTVRIDLKTHEAVQIRSQGFRTGVTGEIEYLPNVLGGTRWMKQNRYDPEKGGLRLRNCVALQG